jgi:hypothetical protein
MIERKKKSHRDHREKTRNMEKGNHENGAERESSANVAGMLLKPSRR